MAMGMSIEPSGDAYVTTTVFNADQFGIYTGSNPGDYEAVFFAQNGQVFINNAFIKDLSVTNEKIGGYIRSDNYVAGKNGWNIAKDGSAEFQSGTFRGAVYADSGTFKGTVQATDGYFYGTVKASKVEGDISATYAVPGFYTSVTSSAHTGRRTVYYTGGQEMAMRISIPMAAVRLYSAAGALRWRITINGSPLVSPISDSSGWINGAINSDFPDTSLLNSYFHGWVYNSGYVDVAAGASNVPITIEWAPGSGQSTGSGTLRILSFSIIASPAGKFTG
nr:DUF1983 domain-containing protein [Mangrovibacter sp. MFB070]